MKRRSILITGRLYKLPIGLFPKSEANGAGKTPLSTITITVGTSHGSVFAHIGRMKLIIDKKS